jgi:hypothetical protein
MGAEPYAARNECRAALSADSGVCLAALMRELVVKRHPMAKLPIPRPLRLVFLWSAAFTLVLALRFESDYRDRLGHLPSLVDEHGNTASPEAAMAGLDSYERAKQIRRFGFVSLGAGMLFCVGWIFTKSQRKEPRVA